METQKNEEQTLAQLTGITAEQADVIANMGCDLANSGRFDDARVVFEGMVTLNPHDAAAQAALGTVYQKLGRTDDALAAYDACLKLDPKHPVALANRGELKVLARDASGWLDLAKALEADPQGTTVGSRRARAMIEAVAKKEKEAKENAQKAKTPTTVN